MNVQHYKLVIVYDSNSLNALFCPDGRAKDEANKLIRFCKMSNFSVVISSELIMNEIRLAVKEKRLDFKLVELFYKKEKIEIFEDGRLSHWPKGFCDTYENQLQVI